MTRDPLFLVQRLLEEARTEIALRDPDLIRVANVVARAGGKLREHLEGSDAEVLGGRDQQGEPVEGYALPMHVAWRRRVEFLLDKYAPCWEAPFSDHPLIEPGPHKLRYHPDAKPEDAQRGYHRLVCTVCHRNAFEDTSG